VFSLSARSQGATASKSAPFDERNGASKQKAARNDPLKYGRKDVDVLLYYEGAEISGARGDRDWDGSGRNQVKHDKRYQSHANTYFPRQPGPNFE
jgi:hypothetical protein